MECSPWARVDVVNVANPEDEMGEVPRTVEPSRKVSTPSGTTPPPADEVMVAVNVTLPPTAEGFWLETRVMDVPSRTTCDKVALSGLAR